MTGGRDANLAIVQFADSFAPPNVGPWTLRRVRLLVAIAFGLCFFAVPLCIQLYLTVGTIDTTIAAFVLGAVAMAANPFILRRTQSFNLVATLVLVELMATLALQTYYNGGLESAALIWCATVPLVAMALLGPRASAICALLVALHALGFYAAGELGVRFPRPLTAAQMRWWQAAGLATVPLFVALVASVYEKSRRAAEERAETALEQLRTTNSALVEARDLAQGATHAKSDFLANMSHEIRTPLNAVIGMTELLAGSDLSPTQRDMADTARSSGEALLSLVNDILDLSKIEAGGLELEDNAFDLRACIENSVLRASTGAAAKGLELTYCTESNVPEAIRGDDVRLGQVLVNLLANSVKFTEAGEVSLVVSATPRERGEVLLEMVVRDTGVGIPADRLPTLFDPFTQADASTTRKFGGTGLGLAIVKRIVDKLGGTVSVESTVGRGSCFSIGFSARTAGAISRVELDGSLIGKRVLIVDDIDTNRRLLARHVESWGMTSRLASGAAEALSALQNEAPFDLAIIDMKMPEKDGVELAADIKGDPILASLPLVLLTSVGTDLKAEKLAAFDKHVTKPVRQSALYNVLVTALGRLIPAPERSASAPASDSTSALRILLAEDDPINQKVALAMLERLGYSADVAKDGAEALVATRGANYDLVLMDLQMPRMGGLEATRELRRRRSHPLFIVAMTANALTSDRADCLEAGMDDYISKPVRTGALRRVLDECTRRKHPPQKNRAGGPKLKTESKWRIHNSTARG